MDEGPVLIATANISAYVHIKGNFLLFAKCCKTQLLLFVLWEIQKCNIFILFNHK